MCLQIWASFYNFICFRAKYTLTTYYVLSTLSGARDRNREKMQPLSSMSWQHKHRDLFLHLEL